MPEEKVFPSDPNDDNIISQNDPDSDEEEFFDPMTDDEDDAPQNPTQNTVELTHSKRKAMLELRCKVEDAILSNNLYGKLKNDQVKENLRDVKVWGIPLLPSKAHQGTDVVLMKFLKAKDYRATDALHMLRKTMKWRKDHRIDDILDEHLGPERENMWSTHGKDKEGRPICYYTFKALKDREKRQSFFGSDEKYEEFMRWRIQCIERGIRKILFKEGEVNSVVQIVDLKNTPATAMKEVEWIHKKMLSLTQEYYPGLIYKNLVINVPVWFMAFHALNLRLLTQRSKNKVVFVRSAKVTGTLLKYITPENLPVQYDGLYRENDEEFSTNDKVVEVDVKANATTQIEIPINEADVTVTWDVTMVGHEVTYKEEFVPTDDCSYKVLLQQEKKIGGSVRNFFHIREPGSIVITIENGTYKKRKAFYRYKSKPSVPLYRYSMEQ